jgi:imidazolonepropionase
MPEPTLWIRNTSQVVPVTEGFPVIVDGAVICCGDRIAWVGPDGAWPDELAPGPDAQVLDAGGGVVLPGLVECHTHLVFGGSRAGEFSRRLQGETYEQILASGGGILGTVGATRGASKEELLERSRSRMRDFLRRGVTTVEIKSGYGLDLDTELKILQVAAELHREGPWDVVSTFLGAHAMPAEHRDDRETYLREVTEQMIPAVAEGGLARFCDVFCEPGLAYGLDESRRVLEAARAAGLLLKVHADQLSDGGGGALAGELGAISAEHLDHVSEAGITAMADAGTVAVLLPGAQYFLGGDPPPLAALQEAGVPVALSTDCNPGSSPTTDLLLMASMACVRWRMTMADALRGITSHAARALSLDDDRGVLAPGMRADVAVFDVPDHRDLAYWFGHDPCAAVIKDGVVVVEPLT